MVSRGYFGVFDGDGSEFGLAGAPGSDVIEKLFSENLIAAGHNVTPSAMDGGSDYVPFMDILHKPIGGLFTGTGIDEDACYHQACDTYENANATVLTANAKAAAHVLATLAMRGTELIPKNVTLARRFEGGGSIQWTVLDDNHGHSHTCGHDV